MTPPSSAPPNRETSLARDVLGTFTHFVRGQLLIGLFLIVFYVVGFYLIELEYWWAAGICAGAFAVIPFVGVLIGAIPAIVVAGVTGTVPTLIWTLVVLALGQVVEALILTPRILGRQLSLHPAVVFLVAILGGIVAGPIGAFLAAPIAAAALLIWRKVGPRPA